MRELLASGRLIDVALAIVCLEIAFLLVARARTKTGLRPLDVLGQLLSGAFLLLALRCALTGADAGWTILFFSASFPAHLFDLARRKRNATQA
jgi:hypothetical protein